MARWLEHHELPAGRVVQAFVTAQAREVDAVCHTCPSCCNLVDLDPASVVQPTKKHTCGNCLYVLVKALPTVCNPIAAFQPIVQGGILVLDSSEFVCGTDADLARPTEFWTRG